MSDYYSEWIVKRKTPGIYVLAKGAMLVLTMLAFLLSFVILPYLLVAGVILAVVDYFLFMRWDLEFEYLYVNGELDIDKIMSRTKRKRIQSLDISKLELLAPLGSHRLDSYTHRNLKTMDFSSQDPAHKMYVMIINTEKETAKVIFEPGDKILDGIKSIAPRKVFMD